LIDGLSRVVLLKNIENEYFALLPSIAKPILVKQDAASNWFNIEYNTSNVAWLANTGESTYFLYPIHASGFFLSSKSISSSLYLLLLKLMNRKYDDAFKLIEGCVSDMPLTPQEKQIYDLIATVKDDVNPEMHACRLKLYFVTYGCRDIMPYQFVMENEMYQYISKLKYITATCRLTCDEEEFILSRIPGTSELKTLHMINREKLIKAAFPLSFESTKNVPAPGSFIPTYPKYPEYEYSNLPVDIDIFDTNQSSFKNFLSKFSIVKFTRPESMSGAESIEQMTKMLDEQKTLNFFYLYELLTNVTNIKILEDESSFGMGSVLLRFLPTETLAGVQSSILRVMEAHPSIAEKMPVFEDKRKMKIPTFGGSDVYQSHLKACATFLKTQSTSFNFMKLFYNTPPPLAPPGMIDVRPLIDSRLKLIEAKTNLFSHDMRFRQWIIPRIVDYTCSKRLLTIANIPDSLKVMSAYFTEAGVTNVTEMPLQDISLSKYVEQKASADNVTSSASPLTVLNHPLSRSHIARTTVSRLEQDIYDFSTDQNKATTPRLAFLNSSLDVSDTTRDSAITQTSNLISSLEQLREKDTSFIKLAIAELLKYANGEKGVATNDYSSIKHGVLLVGNLETIMVSLFTPLLFFVILDVILCY
jgi:hypothetical protein